jgi:methanogenic corrinoid protein MtbC1
MVDQRGEFLRALDAEDRAGCVEMALHWLEMGQTDVATLYREVLVPAMNEWACAEGEQDVCVWKEHVRTSIVRTVVEAAYPHVVKQAARRNLARGKLPKAAVLCPPDELHDLGARMVADYFTLAGFETTFVGASTPVEDFVAALGHYRPAVVAVSVTNRYNLIALRDVVSRIRGRLPDGTRVVVGGRAVRGDPDAARQVGADLVLDTLEDIRGLLGGA